MFAFRLHQFVSGGGDVFTTLEAEGQRFITLNGQQFKPGEREKTLFPVVFCRHCGQEYYPGWASLEKRRITRIAPREFNDRAGAGEDGSLVHGYFMPDPEGLFVAENLAAYPEEWLEIGPNGNLRISPSLRKWQPIAVQVSPSGKFDSNGLRGWFIRESFRFCLNLSCDAVFSSSVRGDVSRLGSLSAEGGSARPQSSPWRRCGS